MTMSPQLGRRDRRTLVIGVATVSALIGLSRGLPALRAWMRDRAAQARAAAEQLAAVESGIRRLPALRESLVVRRARLAALDSVIPAESTPAGVAAVVASILEGIADENDVKLATLQLRADTTVRAGRVRVSVRVGGVADVTGLAGLLQAIEAGETPLVVRDLSVSQPEPVAPDSKPEALRFDISVAGLGRIAARRPEVRE